MNSLLQRAQSAVANSDTKWNAETDEKFVHPDGSFLEYKPTSDEWFWKNERGDEDPVNLDYVAAWVADLEENCK